MRDPKRIKKTLRLIRKIWLKNPDLRLCQLIGNCFVRGDNYYKSDGLLEKRLREVYLNVKPYTSKQLEKIKKAFQKKIKDLNV